MKRDMELIRRILLAVENGELSDANYHNRIFDDVPEDIYFYHVNLLKQAGFLTTFSMDGDNFSFHYPCDLTWNGHEFLDAIRHDTVWEKVKAELGPKVSSVPFQIISGLGLAALKSTFGL